MVFSVPFWQLSADQWPESKILAKKQEDPDFPLDLKVSDDTGMAGSRTYRVDMPVMADELPEAAQVVENLFVGIPGLTVYTLDVTGLNGELKLEDLEEKVPSLEVGVVCVAMLAQDVVARVWDSYQRKDGLHINVLENRGGACKIKLSKSIPADSDRDATSEYLKAIVDVVFGSPADVVVIWPGDETEAS
jgi:hypothetical protein